MPLQGLHVLVLLIHLPRRASFWVARFLGAPRQVQLQRQALLLAFPLPSSRLPPVPYHGPEGTVHLGLRWAAARKPTAWSHAHTHHSHRPCDHTASPGHPLGTGTSRAPVHLLHTRLPFPGCSGPGSARFPASRWVQQASPPARNSLTGHGREVGAKAEEKAHWGSLEGACGSPGPAPAVRACAGEGPHARSNIRPDTTALVPAPGGQPWAPGIPGSEPRPPASSWGHSVKPRPSAGPGPSDQTPETGPSQLQKRASPHPEAGRLRSGAVWSGLCEGPLWLRMLPPHESRWRPFNKGTKPVPEGPTS